MAVDFGKAKVKTLGTNEAVPAGFVCLGEIWPADGTRGRDRDRIKRGVIDGVVDAYRRVRFDGDKAGPVYVNESEAKAFLTEYGQDSAKEKPAAKAVTVAAAAQDQACRSLSSIDTTLDEIYGVLERLTLAVESIATQPKTPHERLMATVESNGFHN